MVLFCSILGLLPLLKLQNETRVVFTVFILVCLEIILRLEVFTRAFDSFATLELLPLRRKPIISIRGFSVIGNYTFELLQPAVLKLWFFVGFSRNLKILCVKRFVFNKERMFKKFRINIKNLL